jgi:hypothetical protein
VTNKTLRSAVAGSLVLWLACAVVWIALLMFEKWGTCPAFQPDDSGGGLIGDARWHWLPPGNSCTYRIGDQTHTDEPPTARLAVLALLILWPTSTVVIARAAARDRAGC